MSYLLALYFALNRLQLPLILASAFFMPLDIVVVRTSYVLKVFITLVSAQREYLDEISTKILYKMKLLIQWIKRPIFITRAPTFIFNVVLRQWVLRSLGSLPFKYIKFS